MATSRKVPPSKAKTKKGGGTVSVWINPGDQVIVTRKPKAEQFPTIYFYRWLEECQKVDPEIWQRVTKHHPQCKKQQYCVCPKSQIAIADMHTMELVNAIKWCIRQADAALRVGWNSSFSESRASLLARSPQWAELLEEAKKRKLLMINHSNYGDVDHYAAWFEQALIAVAMRRLDHGNKAAR